MIYYYCQWFAIISFFNSLTILLDIPSCPELLLFSKESIAFIVSISVMQWKLNDVSVGVPKYCIIMIKKALLSCSIVPAKLLPILAKYTLNAFAIAFGSDNSSPSWRKRDGTSQVFFYFGIAFP